MAGYGEQVKLLDVLGVRVEMPTNQPIVLLRERDGDRYLPIWIGAAQAGVEMNETEDDEVEKFKEFLDHVSAADFDTEAES